MSAPTSTRWTRTQWTQCSVATVAWFGLLLIIDWIGRTM